jgi:serine/threonine protein phosphatase PrpC
VVHSGAYGNRGLKATLEDVELQVFDLAPFGPPALAQARTGFWAIFDGHAGRAAAEYCEEYLHKCAFNSSLPISAAAVEGQALRMRACADGIGAGQEHCGAHKRPRGQ